MTENKALGLFIFLSFVPKILLGRNFVPKLDSALFKMKLDAMAADFDFANCFLKIFP